MKNPASLLVRLDTWDGAVGFENNGWYMAGIEVIWFVCTVVRRHRVFTSCRSR